MVNVTTNDILSEEAIRRVIEEERQWPLVFNRAFRDINMPDDYPAKTMHIPKDEGLMSEPRRVTEGSEYPRTEEGEETIPVTVKKHGFEVAITWESTEFSVFDVIARQTEKAARRFNEYINGLAFNIIDDTNNQHPNSPVQPGDTSESSGFDFGLVTYAERLLKDEQLMPDMMVVNTRGEHVIKNSDGFQRATDLADEMIREGAIGRYNGLDVMVDQSGRMSDTTAEGYLIDTDEYGYEVVKEDITTEQYEAPERDSDVWKWRTMRNWLVVHSEAAIKFTE